MTKLETLYTTIENLEDLGIDLPEDVIKKTAELEELLIKKEILPIVKEKVEPVLGKIQREITLVIDYVPGTPIRLRISHESGIYNESDFVELTPDPQSTHSTHIVVNPSKHSSPTGLRIIRKDGSAIQEKFAGDTLVAAIKEAGAVRVRGLNIICCRVPLVSTTKDKKYGDTQVEVEPGLYVIKHSNNQMKKNYLEQISKAFNLGWKVEIL